MTMQLEMAQKRRNMFNIMFFNLKSGSNPCNGGSILGYPEVFQYAVDNGMMTPQDYMVKTLQS